MKTKEKIREWILENCMNSFGEIDLQDLDFGDNYVFLSGLNAGSIWNNNQKANEIFNYDQEANNIYNHDQEATEINNNRQLSKKIYN